MRLLIISSLFILSLHSNLFPTSLAKPSSSCPPSACGIIPNISSPLRLKGAPNHCGDRRMELVCENNVPSIYLTSHKYYVKDINYENKTIRLVDASINNEDICSFPNSSTYAYNFTYPYPESYPYDTMTYSKHRFVDVAWPIHFMRCPTQLKFNSSLFIDITHDCASFSSQFHPRFTHIKVGHMDASKVPERCRVEVIVMTSLKFNDSHNNVSLSDIHRSLLYGFELVLCPDCGITVGDNAGKLRLVLWVLLLILVWIVVGLLICAWATSPVIVLTAVAGLLYYVVRLLIFYESAGFLYEAVVQFVAVVPQDFFYPVIVPLLLIDFMILAPRIILFSFAFWFLIHKFRRRHLSEYNTIESFLQSDNKITPIRYSYSDIKKLTKNFQEKLGEGGYGSVYKGKLRSGLDVAVKILGKSGASGQDFVNEISSIGRIHHVNVVKLVGYCAQGTKRALVFDFMPNGSLEKYLFNRETMNSLNWDTKFGIAIGIARGIEYLHKGCDIQILHFDIKPHNILLDDKFIPKISDFGLAKFCSADKKTITMTAARGTIGYVAPELINRSIGSISYKADVYSFGMLLMEMVNLNRHLKGNNCDSSQYFPNWIYDHFNQGKDIEIEIVDENDENDSMRKLARKIAIVGLWCIQMSPDHRPPMNEVLKMLEGDVELLQIPDYPSMSSTHIELNMDQVDSTCTTDSLPLFRHDNVLSNVEITIAK